jgi:hypothetical protein
MLAEALHRITEFADNHALRPLWKLLETSLTQADNDALLQPTSRTANVYAAR